MVPEFEAQIMTTANEKAARLLEEKAAKLKDAAREKYVANGATAKEFIESRQKADVYNEAAEFLRSQERK